MQMQYTTIKPPAIESLVIDFHLSWCCMSLVLFLFSGSSRTEEAAELYTKAGNTFKMAKKWAGY